MGFLTMPTGWAAHISALHVLMIESLGRRLAVLEPGSTSSEASAECPGSDRNEAKAIGVPLRPWNPRPSLRRSARNRVVTSWPADSEQTHRSGSRHACRYWDLTNWRCLPARFRIDRVATTNLLGGTLSERLQAGLVTFAVLGGTASLVALSLVEHPALPWDFVAGESVTRFMANVASASQVVLAIATVATLVVLLRQFTKQREEARRAASEDEWRVTLTSRTTVWSLDAGQTEFIQIDLHYGGTRAIQDISMHCSDSKVENLRQPPLSVLLGPMAEIANATWIYRRRIKDALAADAGTSPLQFTCRYVDSLGTHHNAGITVGLAHA